MGLAEEIVWLKAELKKSLEEIHSRRQEQMTDRRVTEERIQKQISEMKMNFHLHSGEMQFQANEKIKILMTSLEQERSNAEALKTTLLAQIDELNIKFRETNERRFNLENDRLAHGKNYEMRDFEMESMRHEMSHLRDRNQELESQMAANLRITEELVNLGAQRTQEVQVLESELIEKSQRLITYELQLGRQA